MRALLAICLLLLGCEPTSRAAPPNATVVMVAATAPAVTSASGGASSSPTPPPTPSSASADSVRIGDVVSSPAAPVEGAARIAAGFRPRFRACYQTAISQGQAAETVGSISVIASVTAGGRVESASVSKGSKGLIGSRLEACVLAVVRAGHFTAPGGDGSLIEIPLTFGTASM